MAEKNEAVEAEKATKKAAAPKADAAKKPAAKKAPAKTSAADAKADGSAKAAPKKDAAASRPGVLKVHHLRPVPGSNTAKTRVGRGEGSKGKTAGRGTKGTKARNTVRVGFEGGQMPLHMRTPKLRGFKNPFRVEYQVVNLEKLAELYPQGGDVTVSDLVAKGAVRKNEKVKVLGNGDIAVKLTVAVDKVSGSAEQKIVAAGGSVK
ncbi:MULTISPECIES: 50S ribosomal protein L15 [unclassified Microbacterium]|uniref:50S ribosomal protein L15 n=1 Tax=unclassified Microbacterium TaxID=2609290 RepID=UPI00185F5FF3|nr:MULTISPECIES: 50S ribosomal protein L15 [unclassified Microbacterium]CAD5141057.1 50S ribosomal protein L15 [Microbacterium sp. Nx66]